MNFIQRVAAKYPQAKQRRHQGDSYLIYEGGNRTTEYPSTKKFNRFVEENEGPVPVEPGESDSVFQVNPRTADRGTQGLPDEESIYDRPPSRRPGGYPDQSFVDKTYDAPEEQAPADTSVTPSSHAINSRYRPRCR